MSTPFYDLASLVVVPSGYKSGKVYAQKPQTTDGQLAFTRASSASRVASNGLIEKVRTNLFLRSEELDNAAWTKADTTIVANAVANPLNGAVTADKITDSSTATAARYFFQSPASSGTIYTSSGYFKKAEYNFVTLHAFGLNGAVFNLDTGVKVSQSGGVGNITSVGNGWYRCTFSFTAGGSAVFFSQSPAGNISYAGTAGSGIFAFGCQLETGDIATDYIPTTTAAVSVGPVSGLPRLDYLNSTCPRLILEGQRTNAAQYSEQLNNAAWAKNGVSVTANSAVSPDGYTNADKIVEDATTGPHGLTPTYSIANSTTYTFSIFAKKAENDYFIMNIYTGVSSTFTSFNVANGTIGTTGAGATAKIENYANGWYRCSLTVATAATGTPNIFMWTARANDAIEYTGNGTNGTFLYGCQLEAGAYATSYIPTLGASVTRVADAASKTGISSLIGQTEGVMFVDINRNYITSSYDRYFAVDDADATIYRTGIYLFPEPSIDGRIYLSIRNNNTAIYEYTYNNTTMARLKIAMAYKSGDIVYYINGTQVATSSATFTFAHTLSRVLSSGVGQSVNQTLLFNTRLTNAQLAELTTL